MKSIIALTSICVLFAISCTNSERTEYSIDSIFKTEFDQTEKEQLKEIVSFFDSIVLTQTNQKSIDSGYHLYMENLRYNESHDEFIKKISMNKPEIVSFLNDFKSNSIFHDIFMYEYGKNWETSDTLSVGLNPNYNSDYLVILNKAIEYDTIFKYYKKSVMSTGSIPPSLVAGFQNQHDRYDFDNELLRLIVAIHYISINSLTEYK